MPNAHGCTITETHCEQCGSTDFDDIVVDADDSYSGCCNELITDNYECRNHHARQE